MLVFSLIVVVEVFALVVVVLSVGGGRTEDGETVFRHACKMGLEGIISKRRNSPYRSGRSPDWLKMKNPACEAVRREEEEEEEEEEDWGR